MITQLTYMNIDVCAIVLKTRTVRNFVVASDRLELYLEVARKNENGHILIEYI